MGSTSTTPTGSIALSGERAMSASPLECQTAAELLADLTVEMTDFDTQQRVLRASRAAWNLPEQAPASSAISASRRASRRA